VINCVSAVAESLAHQIIRPKILPRYESDSRSTVLGSSSDGFELEVKCRAFRQRETFVDYIQTVLLRNPAELPTLDEFAGEIAVLLIEDCSSHISRDVIAILAETQMCVVTFALHTSQIFQVLGVTRLGVRNRHSRYELPFGDEKTIVKFIMKG
jgi:hypothetical protein